MIVSDDVETDFIWMRSMRVIKNRIRKIFSLYLWEKKLYQLFLECINIWNILKQTMYLREFIEFSTNSSIRSIFFCLQKSFLICQVVASFIREIIWSNNIFGDKNVSQTEGCIRIFDYRLHVSRYWSTANQCGKPTKNRYYQ